MSYVAIDGVDIWLEDSGGHGPIVVLLHGAAGSSECWVAQTPAFVSAGYRVIAYDLRGFGKTQPRPGLEASGSIAGDLEALVRVLAMPQFFLVAQAYGGFGALEYALDNPATLRGLVVSTSFGGLSDSEFTAMRARHIRADLSSLPVEQRELGASYLASNPEGVKRFLAMEKSGYRGDGARQTLRQPTTLTRLEGMAVPALILAADEDLYAPPPVMQALAEHIAGAEFEVIVGAGHCAYWEKPDEWDALVLRFLDKHRTT
ncbi:MAG TPA: alpha/beta hydrolase [Dehalococcoidia bacterium]|nr:alpha/beta hydrolase [Dehalococcoidia bacterium]